MGCVDSLDTLLGATVIMAGVAASYFRPLVSVIQQPRDVVIVRTRKPRKYDLTRLKRPLELAYIQGNIVINALGFGKTVQTALKGAAFVGNDATVAWRIMRGFVERMAALGNVVKVDVLCQARFAMFFTECLANIMTLVWCILLMRSKGFKIRQDLSTMLVMYFVFFYLFSLFPQLLHYFSENGFDMTLVGTIDAATRFAVGPSQSSANIPTIFLLFAESLTYLFTSSDTKLVDYCASLLNLLCLAQIWNWTYSVW